MRRSAIFMIVGTCILVACAPAGPEDAITKIRATPVDYIHVRGGINDGAAAGQETSFVVTPDDRLICAFTSEKYFPTEVKTVKNINGVVPGLYALLQNGLGVPTRVGSAPVDKGEAVYVVEVSLDGTKSWMGLGWDDPGLERLDQELLSTPNSCWSFG